jgi:hypothetical protein
MKERWFIVEGVHRSGPLSFEQLLAAVRSVPDPTAALVWRRGLEDWARADAVARLAEALAAGRQVERAKRLEAQAPAPHGASARRTAPALLLAAVAVVAVGAGWWLLRPRGPMPASTPLPAEPRPPLPSPGLARSPNPASTPVPATPTPPSLGAVAPGPRVPPAASPGADRLADVEAELPAAELSKLRGVAAWSADSLRLTVYNGTRWRVTALRVRLERLSGDDFAPDPEPLLLLPPQPTLDQGVADLLARVAPERKKAGLNPLDTGVFEGRAGLRPEGFRWQIVAVTGYPPLRY